MIPLALTQGDKKWRNIHLFLLALPKAEVFGISWKKIFYYSISPRCDHLHLSFFSFQVLEICGEPTLTWEKPITKIQTNISMPGGTMMLLKGDLEVPGLPKWSGEAGAWDTRPGEQSVTALHSQEGAFFFFYRGISVEAVPLLLSPSLLLCACAGSDSLPGIRDSQSSLPGAVHPM